MTLSDPVAGATNPPHTGPISAQQADFFADFLAATLPKQPTNIADYRLPDGEQVWIKKAGRRHSRMRYLLLGALTRMAALDVLHPVINHGGQAAVATEAARLGHLRSLGLRVPAVLAQQPEGLMLAHLGAGAAPAPALADLMRDAVPQGAAPVLALWHQGLAAIGLVHARGACLSQAFARNMVRCPDGAIGCIDFEDDPLATLPLAFCQVRDALFYVHSTALYLRDAGALPAAQADWQIWRAAQPAPVRAALADTVRKLHWATRLPADRRWGRDLQRVRAACDVLRAGT